MIALWIAIVAVAFAFILGWAVAAIAASSGKGDLSAQVAKERGKVAALELDLSFWEARGDTWTATVEAIRDQRDDATKVFGRAVCALEWLVDETPGLDSALEYPPDAGDIIERVETLREGLGRQDAVETWREFVGGECS